MGRLSGTTSWDGIGEEMRAQLHGDGSLVREHILMPELCPYNMGQSGFLASGEVWEALAVSGLLCWE
jgi:hypothetical protein